MELSWIACNCNHGDNGRSFLALDFIGTVVPEDAEGAWSIVLSVSFKDLLAIYAREGREIVCVKTWMARVNFEVSESLANLTE